VEVSEAAARGSWTYTSTSWAPSGLPNCGGQVDRLKPESDGRVRVVDLEPLDVESAGVEIGSGWVGVVAESVVRAVMAAGRAACHQRPAGRA